MGKKDISKIGKMLENLTLDRLPSTTGLAINQNYLYASFIKF